MSTEHTPIPWDVQNKGTLGCRSARHEVVRGVNVDGSKNLPTICRMPDLSERSYANAAFIVRACNAHYDLLKALRAAVERMEAVASGIPVENRHEGVSQAKHVRHMAGHLAEHAKLARAVIAKAQELLEN